MQLERHYRQLGGLLAILLAACASGPAPAPVDPAATAAAFGARSLDVAGALDRAQWLQAALQWNPQLAEARAHVAEAAAAERSAAERPNPTLDLFAEYVGAAAHSATWLYGLSLDFLLRRPSERARALRFAALQTALADSDLAEAIWSVRAELRLALLDVAAARDESALLQQLIAGRQTLLASDRARAAAGDIAQAEVLADELELSRAQQRLRQAEGRGSDARARLAAAVGVPLRALDALTVQWPGWSDIDALPAPPPAAPRATALIGRPQIVHALREYDQAEVALQGALARRWPELHLTPGYAWGQDGVREDPLNGFTQESALAVNFELPIFNQHQGPIGEALARRDAAGKHLVAVQAELFAQIDRAEQAWPRARSAWEDAIGQSNIAARQSAAEQRALSAGAGDRARLAGADIAAAEAELLVVSAAYGAQIAFGGLEDAYRRPLEGPETQLALPAGSRS